MNITIDLEEAVLTLAKEKALYNFTDNSVDYEEALLNPDVGPQLVEAVIMYSRYYRRILTSLKK
jgi:hypothetical protein